MPTNKGNAGTSAPLSPLEARQARRRADFEQQLDAQLAATILMVDDEPTTLDGPEPSVAALDAL